MHPISSESSNVITITSEFTASSNKPPAPPIPTNKPILPKKPKKPSENVESFANPIANVNNDNTLSRPSVLYARPKSTRYVKQTPIEVPAAPVTTESTPSKTNESSGSLLSNLLKRVHLTAPEVQIVEVEVPTIDDKDYENINTLDGRIRILELHHAFAKSNNVNTIEAKPNIRLFGNNNKVEDTSPISCTDVSSSMKHRLLIREGPMEKLNRADAWEAYHFILTHNAIVYCQYKSYGGIKESEDIPIYHSPDAQSPNKSNSSHSSGKMTSDQKESRLIYHRTVGLETVIVA